MLHIKSESQFNNFNLNIDQQLPTDQIIGLFGASGCGKSRFIRQLVGFDRHYQNECHITFNDQVWQDTQSNIWVATQQRGIGYLPQTIDLFPHLNVHKNITFGCDNANHSIDKNWLLEVVTQLDIKDLLEKMPRQLSGGQQQRVALARAICAATNILILDEPLSAIGEDHKHLVMQLLKYVQKEKNIPIIFSSHSRVEHAFLTDYIATFNSGGVEQSGNYEEISTDISGNFSQMSDAVNHIQAEVVEFETENHVNHLKTAQHQLWAGYQPLKTGSLVNLEVRAQDISIFLSEADKSSILNNLKVEIIDFEEVSRHQYIIKLAFEGSFLIAFITKKSFTTLGLKKNQRVFAKFKSVSVLPISFQLDEATHAVKSKN